MEIGGGAIECKNKWFQIEKEARTDIHTVGRETIVGHIIAFPKFPCHGAHTIAYARLGINRVIQSHKTADYTRNGTNLAFGIVEWQNVANVAILLAVVNHLIAHLVKIQARHQSHKPTKLVVLSDRKAHHRDA